MVPGTFSLVLAGQARTARSGPLPVVYRSRHRQSTPAVHLPYTVGLRTFLTKPC